MSIATQRTASMASRPKRTTPETPSIVEIELCGLTIQIDAEDEQRIAEHKWYLDSTANVVKLYRWFGPFDSHRIPQLLACFLLDMDPQVYCEQIKPWTHSYSKSNLRVSKHSMIKPKGWVAA
jgi:hypothetical protein